jgi:small subunit ribosomal protein S20
VLACGKLFVVVRWGDMAITKSAKKAHRQSLRRRVFNVRRKNTLHDAVKEVRNAVAAGKASDAQKLLPAAFKAIDKAAKTHVISKNTAVRKKSRLAKAIARVNA